MQIQIPNLYNDIEGKDLASQDLEFVCLWRYLFVDKQYLSKYRPRLMQISSHTLFACVNGVVYSTYSKKYWSRRSACSQGFPNQSLNFLEKIINLDNTIAIRFKWKYVIWPDMIVWENTSVIISCTLNILSCISLLFLRGKNFRFYNSPFRRYFTSFHASPALLRMNGLPLVNLPGSLTFL